MPKIVRKGNAVPAESSGSEADSDMQAIGHQIGSLASVCVVAAVQFGIPLTPGQQSSILSVIAVAWALFATIYGIRHRIPRKGNSAHEGDSSDTVNKSDGLDGKA